MRRVKIPAMNNMAFLGSLVAPMRPCGRSGTLAFRGRWESLAVGFCFLCLLSACGSREKREEALTRRVDSLSVNTRGYLMLGGASQYVETFGTSQDLPLLLFIHGGPGWPQTPMLRHLNADLGKHFIVATWDQRGCGLSYMRDSAAANMSLAQIVSDAHDLTGILQKKFGQKKILLAGFSWGSIVGMELARKYPEDYSAYVAISQVVNISAGMAATRDWLRKEATDRKDAATINALNKLKGANLASFLKQYDLIAPYNGAVFDTSTQAAVTRAMSVDPDYGSYDWNKGFLYSSNTLARDMFNADYRRLDSLPIPLFFLSGRHDWNVPQTLTEKLFQKIRAPHKEQIWFEKSGHGPLEEEPSRFGEVMASLPARISPKP